jgi:DNA-binding CsgD family transcriptional regulator
VISKLAPGRERAHAVARLARVRSYESQSEAASLFMQVVDEAAASDLETLAIAHEGVANCFLRLHERLAEAVHHAERACELGLELGDSVLVGEALGTQLLAETLLGSEIARDMVDRALAVQTPANESRVLRQPLPNVAARWRWTNHVEQAHDVLQDAFERATELGDESSVPLLLMFLGEVECSLGLLESARTRSLEGQELSEQSGQRTLFANHLGLECLASAHLGRAEDARLAADRVASLLAETGARHAELLATQGMTNLSLARREPDLALAHSAQFLAFVEREAIAEPGFLVFIVDRVEALIELDSLDDAVELLDWYEGNARRLGRSSALANCMRCRGLLAAQAGDLDSAIAAFEEALDWHAQVELSLDRARTLLALGATQRRKKRRREARETLDEALAIFERIGAALWAERARSELSRISGRAAKPGALTPAEERVAALVAEGKTNREVAAALFLSDRTVEGHLSRVFAKLNIKHRAEIAPALAERSGPQSDSPRQATAEADQQTYL